MDNTKRLEKLKRELERMSREHSEKMADSGIARSPERLDAERRRARILAHRIAQLIRVLGTSEKR